jgi:hypothetical protein
LRCQALGGDLQASISSRISATFDMDSASTIHADRSGHRAMNSAMRVDSTGVLAGRALIAATSRSSGEMAAEK